jgi:hypothetical protein
MDGEGTNTTNGCRLTDQWLTASAASPILESPVSEVPPQHYPAQPAATTADYGSTAMRRWSASLFSEAFAVGVGPASFRHDSCSSSITPHMPMRKRASLAVGMYHSPPAATLPRCVRRGTARQGRPAWVIELSNNAMQLTKRGWSRVVAPSSERLS